MLLEILMEYNLTSWSLTGILLCQQFFFLEKFEITLKIIYGYFN